MAEGSFKKNPIRDKDREPQGLHLKCACKPDPLQYCYVNNLFDDLSNLPNDALKLLSF